MNELDNKIQRFVAVYASELSMHDHAVLCEGIMTLISDHVTKQTQRTITLHSQSIREAALLPIREVHERFKHLNIVFENWKEDPELPVAYKVAADMWKAIDDALRLPQPSAAATTEQQQVKR